MSFACLGTFQILQILSAASAMARNRVSQHTIPLRDSIFRSPAGLVGRNPTGLPYQIFGGLVSQVLILKAGVSDVGYEPIDPWGEAPGFEFPTNCGLPS